MIDTFDTHPVLKDVRSGEFAKSELEWARNRHTALLLERIIAERNEALEEMYRCCEPGASREQAVAARARADAFKEVAKRLALLGAEMPKGLAS